ncbi:STAS domain-containing protein [Streptomyces sp. NPDC017936]|uniref:STAS domain-containing protein n=1 Tax=Streptomyces sp. NPDC017936 TaxID=3365016 RepID=UPI00379F224D
MNITTAIDGTSARITLRGDIDFDTLSPLRSAVDALPAHVTDLLWDLNHTAFMDVAGLHLLFAPAPLDGPDRRTTVTGLRRQPLRLLLLAADVHPHAVDLTRLLPDTPPTDLQQAAPEQP